MEDVLIVALNDTTLSPNEEEPAWYSVNNLMKVVGSIVALLGLIGNYLCYKTANHMPEATSKYLLKHLAFWDSFAALESTINKHLFYFALDYFLGSKVRLKEVN